LLDDQKTQTTTSSANNSPTGSGSVGNQSLKASVQTDEAIRDARIFAAAADYFSQPSEASGPPHTNRGVRIERDPGFSQENPENTEYYAQCSFDWYQASIPALPDQIQAAFIEHFGGVFTEAPAINGYEHGVSHSALKFTVYWGQHHAHPNVKATSHHAERIAHWVRQQYPHHKVSRADVAFDFCFPGAFDYLTSKVVPLGKAARVASKFVGDPDENEPDYPDEMRTGRTWYFGSMKSDCMITVYEKGLEMRSKGIVDADINLCRLEVRIRPQKLRKLDAATLEPFEMVGFSKWISNAVGEILEEKPTVLPNYDKLEKPALAALTHMADQYAGVMQDYLEGVDRGGKARSWHDLNRFIHDAMLSKHNRRVAAGHEAREMVQRPKA
jgi:hypothetical protein